MIFRRAVVADLDRPEVMPMFRHVLSREPHGMVIVEAKVRATALLAIERGYAAVAEKDGVVVAYIAGITSEHPYCERLQMHVFGWYSQHPGAGFRLFRMLMKWRDGNPIIGPAYLYADPDERLNRIMLRSGAFVVPVYFIP